jgi:protein-tyrosine phosphatase
MIDIHCHILPDIDDGPKDEHEALAMARAAVADGITTIIATPHIQEPRLRPELIASRTEALNHLLQLRQVPLTVVAGCEVSSHTDADQWSQYGLYNSRYVLVEFPHSHLPSYTGSLLQSVLDHGLLPIIAHPERNPGVLRNPGLLEPLVRLGVKVQLTADSLLGTFGPAIQQCSAYLLRRKLVHFLASDAHSASYRLPVLSKGVRAAAKLIGPKAAEMLVSAHPQAVLQDQHF